jgi:hypothetical protein
MVCVDIDLDGDIDTTDPVLDMDPPAIDPDHLYDDDCAVPVPFGDLKTRLARSINFFDYGNETHYLPLCTPDEYYPQYINTKKKFKNFTKNADPLDDIVKKYFGSKYVILPWDGMFEPSTQYQNCYFFSTLTYDFKELQISSAYTLVRCWAVCTGELISQDSTNRSKKGYGWMWWQPNEDAIDFPSNTRICNTVVPPLSAPCRYHDDRGIYRPWGGDPDFAAIPGDEPDVDDVDYVNFMGAWVLQIEKERVNKAWEDQVDWFRWAFYAPHEMVPEFVDDDREDCYF